jgi:dTDP-glucose 4,6-dehydratase
LKDKSYLDQITFVKDRPGHDRRYAIDANKIITQLGWNPLESFETGIQKTIEWYLAHPEWVSAITSGNYRDWVHKQYA